MPHPLSIYCWEGYDDSRLLAPFTERHRVEVSAKTLLSDSEAVADILSHPRGHYDVINLNNPFARDVLHPAGYVTPLAEEGLSQSARERLLPRFLPFFDCALSRGKKEVLGICQRFGPFNLVVNSDRLSVDLAQDYGFKLATEPANRKRYGILGYEDFNVMHICFAAGVDPFAALSPAQVAAFEETARKWFQGALLVTRDCHRLNDGLLRGEIDFYLGGGIYTIARARYEGCSGLRAVTPRSGPVQGRGAVAFVEVTSIGSLPGRASTAARFLEYLLRPEVAHAVAFQGALFNPVAQMGDPRVMAACSAAQLDAIQWETLEQDMQYCVAYQSMPSYQDLRGRLETIRTACFPGG